MDKLVEQVFQDEKPATSNDTRSSKKHLWRGVQTEGMRIMCDQSYLDRTDEDGEELELDEDDEMIWWSWNGKLIGLGDW